MNKDKNQTQSPIEWRSFATPPTLSSEADGRRIEGYAIRFGVESRVMYDFFEGAYFEEIIDRDAVSEELLNRSDVKALMEHNRERLLARSNGRQGTLSLTLDDEGLRYSFEAPNTTEGNDALELVRRGDIAGSSFAFVAKAEDVESRWDKSKKRWIRTIRKISGIYDVSLTADPAYAQTSVEVRSLVPPPEDEKEPIVEEDRIEPAPLSEDEKEPIEEEDRIEPASDPDKAERSWQTKLTDELTTINNLFNNEDYA